MFLAVVALVALALRAGVPTRGASTADVGAGAGAPIPGVGGGASTPGVSAGAVTPARPGGLERGEKK